MSIWSRKKMKETGKIRMRGNYWKAVLAAIIITFAAGSAGMAGGASVGSSSGASDSTESVESSESSYSSENTMGNMEAEETTDDEISVISLKIDEMTDTGFAFFVFWVVTAAVIILGVAVVIDVFLLNPLEIGCRRFFYLNLRENADIKELGYVFDKSYKNSVKIMFFMDVKVVLWTLLFIIPGIVKSYEYRLIPYLLAEDTELDSKEAFAKSRELMKENKWRAFVLDLSFILWNFLSAMTFGLVGIFYSNPYQYSTDAAFYQAVKEESYDRI